MLIISWNINGIQSKFGELQQLVKIYNPDFVCLQKVRNNTNRDKFAIEGYRQLYNAGDCGSWSGVMTYVRVHDNDCSGLAAMPEFERIPTPELSDDGHLQVFAFRNFALVNAYVPYADFKLAGAVDYRKRWDMLFHEFVTDLTPKMPVIICGDLNVVHGNKDTCEKRLEQNRPNFTAWERRNFNQLIADCDLVDAYREFYPERQATTYYGNYREMQTGNRIDYFMVSRSLLSEVLSSEILSDFGTGQSAPIILEAHIEL